MVLNIDTDSWSDTEKQDIGDLISSSSSLTERTKRINQLESSIKEMTDSFNHFKEHESENKNNNIINVNVNAREESSSSTSCWSGFCQRVLPRCILGLL